MAAIVAVVEKVVDAYAKEALATGKTLKEVVLAKGLMTADALDAALDPKSMTKPGESALAAGGG